MKLLLAVICSFVGAQSQGISCKTPNNEIATCKSIFSCPSLKEAIQDSSLQKFVEESAAVCPGGNLVVCCGTAKNYTNVAAKRTLTDSVLPSKIYCGQQHADDYFRDLNTRETTVDEIPWVMFVSCPYGSGGVASSINSEHNFAVLTRDCDCTGVLLNRQFILSSENCRTAQWVGLGQRDQYRNTSCTATNAGVDDCAERLEIPIAEKFFYEKNSLMLLKLERRIEYSDYVRPICLPMEDSDGVTLEDTITTSHWTIDYRVRGFVRNKFNATLTSNSECPDNFEYFKIRDTDGYLCGRLEDDVSVLCKTDSGSPWMYKKGNNWFLGGVLYSQRCYEKFAISNKINREAIDWIQDTMKKATSTA